MNFNSRRDVAFLIRYREGIRIAFAWAVVTQVVGLLFSIALSSIAFGAACFLFAALTIGDRPRMLRPVGLEWPLLIYVASVAIMVVFARYRWDALVNARHVLLLADIYFIPAAFPRSDDLRRFVVTLCVAAACWSCIEAAVYFVYQLDRLRFFQHYMTSAGIKMMVLLVTMPLIFSKEVSRGLRSLLSACSACTFATLVLTLTRSSWLGLIAGVVLIGLLTYRTIILVSLVVVALFVLFAQGMFRERILYMFTTENTPQHMRTVSSNSLRVRMWETGWIMFLDHPLVGVGEGRVRDIYREYVPDAFPDEGGHLHNNFIQILASRGIIGLAGFLCLLGGIGVYEWKAIRAHRNAIEGLFSLGALAAFTGFVVNGLAEYNFGDHEILVLLFTSVGIAIAANRVNVVG